MGQHLSNAIDGINIIIDNLNLDAYLLGRLSEIKDQLISEREEQAKAVRSSYIEGYGHAADGKENKITNDYSW